MLFYNYAYSKWFLYLIAFRAELRVQLHLHLLRQVPRRREARKTSEAGRQERQGPGRGQQEDCLPLGDFQELSRSGCREVLTSSVSVFDPDFRASLELSRDPNTGMSDFVRLGRV